MSHSIRFCLVLHNHQPIGNFDGVFEQAHQDSYLPFLDVFDDFADLPIALHTSGPLLEWLDKNHPEYVDRIAAHVAAGRIEIVGGAFYEPILTMIPPRDRVGQIRRYTEWLEERFQGRVRGMWMPERVWEPSLTSDIAAAGIEYTVLDDFHFKHAGLREDQLHGYYLTEDNGRLLRIFPGSERMRYLIPFGSPEETIDHLRWVAGQQPNALVVFGDDGEKFGTWPDTKQHVYGDGWLRRFFEILQANRDWVHVTTPSEAMENVPPLGKTYLPECSYREMTEWALPVERQIDYDNLTHELEHDERWPRIKQFLRGGFWRNFKVKYPESDEMYARMLMVSERLNEFEAEGADAELLDHARRELYRGQCNCPYWHGAFGGIYLPHLRNAVYNHLIAAENLLGRAANKPEQWVEASADDYNLDARQEVRLANDKLLALIAPAAGGLIYELDVRSICLNLAATITRRPEAYHRKVLAGAQQGDDHVASIHDRVVFKQEGLDQRIAYDAHPRKSLLDHFYSAETSLAAVVAGEAAELGDFLDGRYEARVQRKPDRIRVLLSRRGQVDGAEISITKGITLSAGAEELEIAYLLEDLPPGRTWRLAPEFNFAGLPSGADDRFFSGSGGERLGHLGKQLDLSNERGLSLTDQWLGIEVRLNADRDTAFWTYPIETVSQSEGGFELVHQSVVVQPHWLVEGNAQGRWSVTMRLALDTSAARQRMEQAAAVATT